MKMLMSESRRVEGLQQLENQERDDNSQIASVHYGRWRFENTARAATFERAGSSVYVAGPVFGNEDLRECSTPLKPEGPEH